MFLIVSLLLSYYGSYKAYKYWISIKQGIATTIIATAIFAIIVFFSVGMVLADSSVTSSTLMTFIYWIYSIFILLLIFKPKILKAKSKSNIDGKYPAIDVLGIVSCIVLFIGLFINVFSNSPNPINTVSQTPEVVQSVPEIQPEPLMQPVADPEPVIDNQSNNDQITSEELKIDNSSSEDKEILESTSNDCDNLPSTCGAMSDCKQAYKALACGNSRLDRDDDGIPCESICN